MKYAIVTPTFQPHFKYIDKYLESYNKYVLDKEHIEIIFTISREENKFFQKIVKKYSNINYKIVFFEDLLKKYDINYTPDELLNKYKKFSFQTLKKFYTMLDSDANYFLVLDSESMWIKNTKMVELFEDFYKKPYLAYSLLSNRTITSKFTSCAVENVNYLLNYKCDKWFIENFTWFYDKKILNNLFNEYGSPIYLTEQIYTLNDCYKQESGIFEIVLYQNYIYKNNCHYNYKLINIDELLSKNLNENNYKIYINNFNKKLQGNCGLLEHAMLFLNDSNYKVLANIFKQNNFNIIRCDDTNLDNFALQKAFLDIVQPNILAASQEHAFGVNNAQLTLLKKTKYYKKINEHFKRYLDFLNYLFEPLIILVFAVKFLFFIPKFYRKYNRRVK